MVNAIGRPSGWSRVGTGRGSGVDRPQGPANATCPDRPQGWRQRKRRTGKCSAALRLVGLVPMTQGSCGRNQPVTKTSMLAGRGDRGHRPGARSLSGRGVGQVDERIPSLQRLVRIGQSATCRPHLRSPHEIVDPRQERMTKSATVRSTPPARRASQTARGGSALPRARS